MTDDANDEPDINDAIALAQSLHPLLEGKPAPLIGAALADLVSLLIAGHVADTPLRTQKLRELILEEHIKAVRKLIPLQEAMIRARMTPPTEGRPN
jgi:hypothetical protein